MRLAENLLDRAETDAREPVPVVLQLSTWNCTGDRAEDALGWLVAEIAHRYKAPPDQVTSWLEDDRLVLLLDGLDEIADPDRQGDCVSALSGLSAALPVGMAVCCRTEDYRRIGRRLELDLAVAVLPLAPEQVDRYLAAAGDALAPLRGAAKADPVLAQMLDTPLMLGVATLTCHGPQFQAGCLPAGNRDQRLAYLWDRYTEVMLTRRRDTHIRPAPRRAQFSPQATYRHLVQLARLMVQHNRVEIYPDWFGTQWLPDRASSWPPTGRGLVHALGAWLGWRRTSGLLVGTVIGTTIGMLIGLAYGLGDGRISGLAEGVGYGLTGGLSYALSYGLTEGLPSAKNADAKRRRSWLSARYALGGLCCGLCYGLLWRSAAGLLFGVSHFGPTDGPSQALAGGLLDGAFFGLATRLILGTTSAENAGATWRWSWPAARHGLIAGLCSGAVYGTVYGAASGQLRAPAGALTAGLLSALAFAVINGWQPDFSRPPMRPGQALRRTLHTYAKGITSAMLTAVVLSAVLITAGHALFPSADPQSFTKVVLAVITTGVSTLALGVVSKGMIPWIDHRVARLTAAWAGFLPHDLIAFLDHSDERILLRRSGGYYLFLHRTLRDHLAASDPQNPPFPVPSEPADDA